MKTKSNLSNKVGQSLILLLINKNQLIRISKTGLMRLKTMMKKDSLIHLKKEKSKRKRIGLDTSSFK